MAWMYYLFLVLLRCKPKEANIVLRPTIKVDQFNELVDGDYSTCVQNRRITFQFDPPVRLNTIRVYRRKLEKRKKYYATIKEGAESKNTWEFKGYEESKIGKEDIVAFPSHEGITSARLDNLGSACEVVFSDECSKGFYGNGCSQTCKTGCRGGMCHHVDGSCECEDGWTGTECSSHCQKGFYGNGCSQTCKTGCRGGMCHHVDGSCECEDGLTGTECSSHCQKGFYGKGCSQTCKTGCRGGMCHHVDGSCECEDGWTGTECSSQCSKGFYGNGCSQTCKTGCRRRMCHHVDGSCECEDGWTGTECSSHCQKGFYGNGCSQTCKTGCRGGMCHHVDGSCECEDGLTGTQCSSQCSKGFYGNGCSQTCKMGCRGGMCHHVDGSCECEDGWTGTQCSSQCVPGRYGKHCALTCSEGCQNKTCDPVSGRCENCMEGWEHKHLNTSRCDKKCDTGMYGTGCSIKCSEHCQNQSCHHMNGECLHGCLAGTEGDFCQTAVEAEASSSTMYVVGVVIVLILFVLTSLLFLFRNRLKKKLTSNKDNVSREELESYPMEGNHNLGSNQCQEGEAVVVINGSESVYANYSNIDSSTSVPVSGLKDYVAKKKSKKNILLDEYAKLPQGLTAAHDIALTEHNRSKNRFRGIYPYNHSLVAIKTSKGKPGYINANYIDGPTREKQYIATQGPLPNTVEDFWEMIWQLNIPAIVMLANVMEDGKRRCEPYWYAPDKEVVQFGTIKVSISDERALADYTVRTLRLQKGTLTRDVKHVHYMVWPDKGVPSDTISLVSLRHKLRSLCDFNAGPMVVHCSAGVGRTGTLIALDYLMEQADTHNKVDIYGCVWTMRGSRVKMVQTDCQYVFLHDCLLDALWYTPNPTPESLFASEFEQLKRDSGNELCPNLDVKFKKLQETPVPETPCGAATDSKNLQKNRTEDIVPGDLHRPFLHQVIGDSDYINAVIAPSYQKRFGYILTQIPLTSTVVDFWRLIQDHNIRAVVLLENHTEEDKDCGVFWTKEGQTSTFGPFTITREKTEEHTGFTLENYNYQSEMSAGEVILLRCLFWPRYSSLPESQTRLLSFYDFVRQWTSKKTPLLVVCKDGCTRSGLFCVLDTVLERLALEKEVAINHAIRRMRLVRRQVIPTREQFEFCHDAVRTHIDSFNMYSNLG